MITSGTEQCFLNLKLIKSYLRDTVSEDRIKALATLPLEQSMIHGIPNFNKLHRKFISENNKLEFSFK